MADGMRNHDPEKLSASLQQFQELLNTDKSVENYSGILWFGQTALEQSLGIEPAFSRKYYEYVYRYLAENDCAGFLEFLERNYELLDPSTVDLQMHIRRSVFLQDLVMFNNPLRDRWCNVDKLFEMLPIKPGDRVLDVGSGFGYFTNRLADAVGPAGKVYAIDTVASLTEWADTAMKSCGYDNVSVVTSKNDDITVRAPADCAFICSLYHIIYAWSTEKDRRSFLNSIKASLVKDGYLVIVDNYGKKGDELNRCYIRPELIEAQLHYYGLIKKVWLSLRAAVMGHRLSTILFSKHGRTPSTRLSFYARADRMRR